MTASTRRDFLKAAAAVAAGLDAMSVGSAGETSRDDSTEEPRRSFPLVQDEHPPTIRFFSSDTAELYSREVAESFEAVLRKNYIAAAVDGYPAGFIRASPVPQPWSETMWSRDGGTFLRELVMWGCREHAVGLAECLMDLVSKNEAGFYAFPEYFSGDQPASGKELDGTASIVIGFVLLWQRLPTGHPSRQRIEAFLRGAASPVAYMRQCVRSKPLLAGSGEFGGGCYIEGEYCNVVQNNLAMLALLASAAMAEQIGDQQAAAEDRRLADKIMDAMKKYLVDEDGSWIWCVDPHTMKPDPAVVNHEINRGFGGLNGVACMYSDVLGFDPVGAAWRGAAHCEKTFLRLYATPLRKEQFDKYGIWTQFDVYRAGLSSGPSYGDGYALQTMLLYDKLAMAERSLAWLAQSTYEPVPEYKIDRESPYYFYERSYSPDAVGKIPLEQGCGALNLVNVTEQLKAARLILGVDDSSLDEVRILPRVPASWQGIEARNWPIRTDRGESRADIDFRHGKDGAELTLRIVAGPDISHLAVRMPSPQGNTWIRRQQVRSVRLTAGAL